jgi:murein L,D-transpeptidase YcbB/YkuD
VDYSRNWCTGRRPVHYFHPASRIAAALMLAVAPMALVVPTPVIAETVAAPARAGQSVADFYRLRKDAPLWLDARAGDSAEKLLALLDSAGDDGLDPGKYQVAQIRAALDEARSGKRKAVLHADRMLSDAFAAYVADLAQDSRVNITYVDAQLRPTPPSPLAALIQAANAPSLAAYVDAMGWMHPLYAQLRDALTEHKYSDEETRQRLMLNLERVRALPAGNQRYLLVNAAQQRLYMYEDRKPVDSMVVVVGKPKYPTPMLAAYVRYAALNPYWYVPPDLAWDDVGQFVKKQGFSYFEKMGYQQVSDWTKNPEILDATKIDWDAVREGKAEVLLRQKPGPENFMGRIKFMFPNQFGVYLHDNPRRNLFKESVRYFSGGCVRLEDAWRLSKWLFHRDLSWEGAGIEEPVQLEQPVPVYITYLTAMPDGQSIAYYDDVYGRDSAKIAGSGGSGSDGDTGNAATR